ncbi:MAG: hypothetical protein C5B56_14165 [Proteobacteria bacterium]|nr:MAG: hypothetical protein C5B56_14165 [Pseudomonadota bacterium]
MSPGFAAAAPYGTENAPEMSPIASLPPANRLESVSPGFTAAAPAETENAPEMRPIASLPPANKLESMSPGFTAAAPAETENAPEMRPIASLPAANRLESVSPGFAAAAPVGREDAPREMRPIASQPPANKLESVSPDSAGTLQRPVPGPEREPGAAAPRLAEAGAPNTTRHTVGVRRAGRRSIIQEGLSEARGDSTSEGGRGAEAEGSHRLSSAIARPVVPNLAESFFEPVNATELFQRRDDTERSPSSWAERIKLAFQPPAPPAVTPDATHMEPAPGPLPALLPQQIAGERTAQIPEAARRFLNPRAGIETREVGIYQGPATSRALAAIQADAAAVGESILAGPALDASTPEGLGLLAHELTHVARRREPRFVPPAIRRPEGPARAASRPGAPEDQEERVAEQMETQTAQAAARALVRSGSSEKEPATESSPPLTGSVPPLVNWTPEQRSPDSAPEATAALSRWGGLPAPWEPAPESMLPPSPETTHSTDLLPAPAVSAAANGAAGTGENGVHRAAHGRPSGEGGNGQPARSEGSQDKTQKQVPPDLDQLARQVYSIMKRRLAAERRRELLQ